MDSLERKGLSSLFGGCGLSAADAMHLAAAAAWSEGMPGGNDFVCFDDRLISAARSEGFRVLPA